MKTVRGVLLILVASIIMQQPAIAQNWQTVYETDFSTDPGWITNNPGRFYWDAASESYFTDNYTNSQEWTTTDVAYNGESFRLTFDVMPVRESWETGDVNVGLFGPTRVSNSSSTEERVYAMIGGYGHQIYITGRDLGGEYIYSGAGSYLMQESEWHHIVILYDSDSKLLSFEVTVNSVPVYAWQTVLGYGFSSNLQYLGASMVGSWVSSNRHEVAYIDNVSLSLQTHCGEDDLVQLTSEGGYTARWSPDGSKIVFTSIRHGNHEIYVMNADGTNQTRLTHHPSYDKLPSWHPSGNEIVFVSTRNGGHDIFTMYANGTNVTPIINFPAWDDYPSWSPDGSKLLFESRLDGDNEVYVVDADGSNLQQLTDNSVIDGNAQWSPCGEKICFVSKRDGHYQIYTMNADGSEQQNISNNAYVEDWPAWSPDGRRIVFSSDRDANDELYVMETDGGNPTRLTYCPASDGQPYVSPDGQWLVFHSDRSGTRNIYKMRMPGASAIAAFLDIKPGSCPNPLNVNSYGHSYGAKTTSGDEEDMAIGNPAAWLYGHREPVLPVAILGTGDLDVLSIDLSTIVLESVAPARWSYEDVATPIAEDADECECNDLGPDGLEDLTLKFKRGDVIATLGDVSDGDVIPLTISGMLIDGTPFEGVDCVVIRGDLSLASNQTDGPDTMPDLNLVNSPNPFNPTTEISFTVPNATQTKLCVFNIAGQRVETLVNEELTAGYHTVQWDASKVASGVYFYRLETDNFSASKKMLLLK